MTSTLQNLTVTDMNLTELVFQKGKISPLSYFTCKIKPKYASVQLSCLKILKRTKKTKDEGSLNSDTQIFILIER